MFKRLTQQLKLNNLNYHNYHLYHHNYQLNYPNCQLNHHLNYHKRNFTHLSQSFNAKHHLNYRFNHLNQRLNQRFNQFKHSYHTSSLSIRKIDTVLHLKLNRPNQRNCLNYDLITRLNEELINFQNDHSLKSIILTGSDGNFCAGLDVNELNNESTNDQTLLAFSNLIQLFPLNKPSIVGLEGYTKGAGLQLALIFDYRIVENDTRLHLDTTHLPLHPYIKQLYADHNLVELFQSISGLNSDKLISYFIKHLNSQHLITKTVTTGCCFGVALELGKCIEKFSSESIIYDRNKLYNQNVELKSLFNENVYTRAKRFLNENVGKHGASNTDTLEEIYERWSPKLVQEEELKN